MMGASLVAQKVKNPPVMQEILGSIPGMGKSPGKLSILSWRIPGTEKPGGLQSMGLQRGGQD